MSEANTAATPDLTKGIASSAVPDGGMLLGHVADDEVLLARAGEEWFAIGAHCTHYHGRWPTVWSSTIPSDVRSTTRVSVCGRARRCARRRSIRSPAGVSNGRATWSFVREKLAPAPPRARRVPGTMEGPASIVIIGGGAAGLAAADMLRREGYGGPVTIISADQDPPVDRPNLSKDYLAGEAQDDWIPLWPPEFYAEQRIELDPEPSRDVDRSRVARSSARGWLASRLRGAADRDRRRSCPAAHSWRRRLRTCSTCVRLPTAAPSSRGRKPRNMSWSSARASSGSRWRPRSARAASPSTSSRRSRRRSSGSWARRLAVSFRRCTRRTASSFIWARRCAGRRANGHAQRRGDARRRLRRDGRGRPAGDGAGREAQASRSIAASW